jgi:hypothetical protein
MACTLVLGLGSLLGVDARGESIGNTSVGTSEYSGKDTPLAMRVTLATPLDLASVRAYIKGPPGQEIRVAVYQDNAGDVGTLIAQSAPVQSSSPHWHWQTIPITMGTLAAGEYWIAICFEHNNQKLMYEATGGTGSRGVGLDAVEDGFASPWSEATSTTWHFSMYATTASPALVITSWVEIDPNEP